MTVERQPEMITLGSTDLQITQLGIGTWAWGDRWLWEFGRGYGQAEVEAAFQASLAAGINFFDTAEVYGWGRSEQLLGQFIRASGEAVVVATKFMPYPWRMRRTDLRQALERSLDRLGLSRVDLYQIHWPIPLRSIETWMDELADAVEDGLVRSVGVSNYNLKQMRRAHAALAQRGIPLASNQVKYSLLNRKPEATGLLEACHALGVTLIAYSPLAQGLLTGKYTPQNKPPGLRGFRTSRRRLIQIQPLIPILRQVGETHGGKSPAQVALNWVICKGAVPIPGAKDARQAQENIGALGWRLTDEQVAALDAVSEKMQR